ncbi:MAG: hypothetical protein V4581_09785, partial [Bacteroidota bacterium]
MKKQILSIALVSLLGLTACTEKKQGEVPEQNDTVSAAQDIDATATAAEDTLVTPKPVTDAAQPKEGDVITVTGKVFEINRGKDGYSAKIKTDDDKTYVGTISIPNMTDPKDYRAVKEGETITITGVAFPVEEDIMMDDDDVDYNQD